MSSGLLGMIANPASGNAVVSGVSWCADNAVFGGRYPGDDAYLRWLVDRIEHRSTCAFVTAPDVVGNAAATLARSLPMLPKIRGLGYPAAFVGQDGLEDLVVPWDEFDVFFIGGTTEWKEGPAAASLVTEAKRRGKHVHMGRVNSRRRLLLAHEIGCDSVDGTYLAFGPDRNLVTLLGWLAPLDPAIKSAMLDGSCFRSFPGDSMLTTPTPRPLADAKTVAEYLRVSTRTLYNWRRAGTGPKFTKVGREYRYDWTDVEQYAKGEPANTPPAHAA